MTCIQKTRTSGQHAFCVSGLNEKMAKMELEKKASAPGGLRWMRAWWKHLSNRLELRRFRTQMSQRRKINKGCKDRVMSRCQESYMFCSNFLSNVSKAIVNHPQFYHAWGGIHCFTNIDLIICPGFLTQDSRIAQPFPLLAAPYISRSAEQKLAKDVGYQT